jgi:hypothetical protein
MLPEKECWISETTKLCPMPYFLSLPVKALMQGQMKTWRSLYREKKVVIMVEIPEAN